MRFTDRPIAHGSGHPFGNSLRCALRTSCTSPRADCPAASRQRMYRCAASKYALNSDLISGPKSCRSAAETCVSGSTGAQPITGNATMPDPAATDCRAVNSPNRPSVAGEKLFDEGRVSQNLPTSAPWNTGLTSMHDAVENSLPRDGQHAVERACLVSHNRRK